MHVDDSAANAGQVILRGGSLLAAVAGSQRLLTFLASAAAARLAGPSVFGAYALAISTAGMLSGYTSLGIGNTAARFAAEFPQGTPEYRKTLSLLTIVTLGSALICGFILLCGAHLMARAFFGNEDLTGLLRAAGLVAAAFTISEAANGVIVGLLNFRTLLWLAALSGFGLLLALPLSARHGASAMLLVQALVLLASVFAALGVNREQIRPAFSGLALSGRPRVREILTFGAGQMTAVVGIGLASWWVSLLISRSDPSLQEMGFYGLGNQLKAAILLVPGFFAQLVLPLLVRVGGSQRQDRVTANSALLCASISLSLAGVIFLAMPLVLQFFGPAYQQAALAAALLTGTAVIHVSGVPAAQALTLLDLRLMAVINLFWAVSLVTLACLFVPLYGAAGAGLSWLVSQIFSQSLVHLALKRRGRLPHSAGAAWCVASLTTLLILALNLAELVFQEFRFAIILGQILLVLAALMGFFRLRSKIAEVG